MKEALIGLAGVVVGALLSAMKDFWLNWRSSKKKAEYLAIRVVSKLDRFIEGCVVVTGDDGYRCTQHHGQDEREPEASTPEFEVQSLDVEWKAIPARLMYDILRLPDLVTVAERRIAGVSEFPDPPDHEEYFYERQLQYAKLGLKAAQISNVLCSKYGLPKPDYEDWNPIEYLEQKQKKIMESRAQREK